MLGLILLQNTHLLGPFCVFFLKIISNYSYAGKVRVGGGAVHMRAVPKEARKRLRSLECEPPSMWVLGT